MNNLTAYQEGTGFFCVVIGKTFEGIYTPIDPYTYFKTRKRRLRRFLFY